MHVSKTRLFVTAVILAGLVSVATVGTMARFTDSDAVTGNTFSTKTISLTLDDYTAVWTFSNMMPGDTTTAPIVVTNATGSAALRYAVSSSATTSGSYELKDQLVLTVREIDSTTPLVPCDNFNGTQLYSGDLDSSAGKILGDSTQGNQSGDRPLGVDGTETLCFRVSLPLTTDNNYKSLSTTATFTFDSEQTDNNP
jgi:spore coat-associated protein N